MLGLFKSKKQLEQENRDLELDQRELEITIRELDLIIAMKHENIKVLEHVYDHAIR
jgi:hypothetical protein